MKTYFTTVAISMSLFLVFWLYLMIFTDCDQDDKRNRLVKNWYGGGKVILIAAIVISFLLSIPMARWVAGMNFLESFSK